MTLGYVPKLAGLNLPQYDSSIAIEDVPKLWAMAPRRDDYLTFYIPTF